MDHYLCKTWEEFIQKIVRLIRTRHYFCWLSILPKGDKNRWPTIDRATIEKFQIDDPLINPDSSKVLHYAYLRWYRISLILHTPAGNRVYIPEKFKFIDVRRNALEVSVSMDLGFSIDTRNGNVSVALNPKTYRAVKTRIAKACRLKDKYGIVKEFESLMDLPPFDGLNPQKRRLAGLAQREAKNYGFELSSKELLGKTVFAEVLSGAHGGSELPILQGSEKLLFGS